MNKKTSIKENNQNKKLIVASVILVIVVIISCLSLMFVNIAPSGSDKNSTDTASVIHYETYETIDSDKLFDVLNEVGTTNFVYVGRDTCPRCSAWAPKLAEVIKEQNVLVYYYDTAASRASNVDKLNELMNRLNITSVPAFLKITDGEIVSRLDDYESKEAIINFLQQ